MEATLCYLPSTIPLPVLRRVTLWAKVRPSPRGSKTTFVVVYKMTPSVSLLSPINP